MMFSEGYLNGLWSQLSSVSMALIKKIIIILLIWFIGKKIIKILLNIMSKTFTKSNTDVSLSKFLLSLTKFVSYAILAVTIIGSLGIETASFVTIIGSLGLTVGLSLQGSLSNFAGGVLILLFKPFKIGDYIVACGNEGTVQVIDLLYTKLNSGDNKMITIPNGTLANSNIVNVGHEPFRRVDVSIDVSYNTDLSKAKDVLKKVILANEKVLKDRDINVVVATLGASGITISTRCWVKTPDYWDVLWSFNEKFKEAMDENDITIPYPQLDVHVNKDA